MEEEGRGKEEEEGKGREEGHKRFKVGAGTCWRV